MLITGVSLEEFTKLVEQVGQQYGDNLAVERYAQDLHGVKRPRIRARVVAKHSGYGTHGDNCAPGARRSWAGRRMAVACWHAHRDVLTRLFETHPDAVVITAMARYVGKAGFENSYPGTAYTNIGSMMNPAYMPELCDC